MVEDTPTTVLIDVTPSDDDGGVPIIGYTVSFDTITTRYNLGTSSTVGYTVSFDTITTRYNLGTGSIVLKRSVKFLCNTNAVS